MVHLVGPASQGEPLLRSIIPRTIQGGKGNLGQKPGMNTFAGRRGGRNDSRADAEGGAGAGRAVVCGGDLSNIHGIARDESGRLRGSDVAQRVCGARGVSADGGEGSGGAPKFDWIHGVVELCARRGDDRAGVPALERSQRFPGGHSALGSDRCAAACAGTEEAGARAGRGARLVHWKRSVRTSVRHRKSLNFDFLCHEIQRDPVPDSQVPTPKRYSERRAWITSMRAARAAGRNEATTATESRTKAAAKTGKAPGMVISAK